jgi:predicted nucleotidyltransferase
MHPTRFPDLNEVLTALVARARARLGEQLVAAYLSGSFALGDGDADSDVDFMFVVENDIDDATTGAALQEIHREIYSMPSEWARHLEGSYIPRAVLRQHADTGQPLFYIDNGSRTFERSTHDNTRVVRWVTREHGVTLYGPEPRLLIDPVPEAVLKGEVRAVMRDWGDVMRADPDQVDTAWYQPFAVLSYCRMLHTLVSGRITSKPAAVRWALQTLDPVWGDLISQAWADRSGQWARVRERARPGSVARTLAFIDFARGMSA